MSLAKGKKGVTVPPLLVLAAWCERYHTLPRAGSLLEQDYREMFQMDFLPRVFEAVSRWRQSSRDLSQGDRAMVNWLVKNGIMNRVDNG